MENFKREDVRRLTGTAIFIAIVVILQLLGSFIRFGPFSISLVAVPIVVGSALYGRRSGAVLGLAFGLAVLISGDAALFLSFHPLGTILVVMSKGLACGLAAGVVYALLSKKNQTLAVTVSAVVCPIVNTGIFLLGCLIFCMPLLREWSVSMGFGENVGSYMILGLVGGNFLVELLSNVLLCPLILRLIRIGGKRIR